MSDSRISVSMNDPAAVFTLIEELATRERELLRGMLEDAYRRWLGFASENVLNQLEGFTPQERVSLKVIAEKDILPAHLTELLNRSYTNGEFDLKPKKETPRNDPIKTTT